MSWLVPLFVALLLLFILWKLVLIIRKDKKNVCVVVLGDIGRSPRMQYHAISLVKAGFKVDCIGYPGSLPHESLRNNPAVKIFYLTPIPDFGKYFPRHLSYCVKVLWQSMDLLWVLSTKRISNFILMQNPPAVPTMPLCWIFSRLTMAHFIIDWHNYAYSIMLLNMKRSNILLKLAYIIETYFGTKADNNFCVSNAMKEDLKRNWGIKATVLYDRPPDEFKPISLQEKHEFLLRLSEKYDELKGDDENSTIFTKQTKGVIELLPNRPGLLVSSTSWTEDEDFAVLFYALEEYEKATRLNRQLKLPSLICVITGKGPYKSFYTALTQLKKWKTVKIIMPWLEQEEYPKMLASADLGVCLHRSSSGLDLPMKVVDMFGCQLPVCAINFNCLNELVKHNENSLVFSHEKELAHQLTMWFSYFPANEEHHELSKKFRAELDEFRKTHWHGNWLSKALPAFVFK